MSGRDPFDVVAELNPFAGEFDEFTDADEALLLRILETPVTGRTRTASRSGSRRRRWLVGGAVGVAVVATAAFTYLHRERASNPTGVLCYATADIDGDRAVLPPDADPVAACQGPWTDGTFSHAGAPPLAGCVNDAGVATVLPGDPSVCSRLGLAELEPGRSDEQQAIVELGDRLAEAFSADCIHQDDAMVLAEQLLDESGLEGWTVQLAEDFPPGMECGLGSVLPETKTVIVGGARPAP
jgi:hypothetical protein